ncbi:hypothetical protein Leryth_008690 [Lithospermum erythrorhizon]|nr:hypothetical protein Leryth_008690 [Lithospermum erythrorhizon]
MPDLLAETLGIKELVPPFLDPNLSSNELKTGVCFASAGGGYAEGTTMFTSGLSVFKQLESFKNYMNKLKSIVGDAKGGEIVSDSLVFIVAGILWCLLLLGVQS